MSSSQKLKPGTKKPQPTGSATPKAHDASEEELRAGTIDFNADAKSPDNGSSVQLDEPSGPPSGTSVVSWAEVLRQRNPSKPSDEEVRLGSLAELQIDAVSDNDILKHLEAEGLQAATNKSGILRYSKPASETSPATENTPTPPADKHDDDDLLVPKRSHALAENDDERWYRKLSSTDTNQSSSVDLAEAAHVTKRALKDGESGRTDDADALNDAMYPDDGTSRVNLGMEPRITGFLSDGSLDKKTPAAPARPKQPSKPQLRMGNAKNAWLGGAAVGFTLAACVAVALFSTGWVTPSKRSVQGNATQSAAAISPGATDAPKPDDGTREQIASLMASQQRLDQALQTVSTKLQVNSVDELAPALDGLVTARQKAEEDYRQAEKNLRQTQANLTQANQDLETVRKTNLDEVKSAQAKLDTAAAREKEARQLVAELMAARKDAEESFGSVTEKLRAAKVLGDKADRQTVLKTIDDLLRPKEDGNTKVEIAQLRKSLEGARSPIQMLELWPTMLGSDSSAEMITAALADAEALSADPTGSEETHAKALALKALALVAREDFTAARTALDKVAGAAALNRDAGWTARLNRAAAELRDSTSLREQIRRCLDRGDGKEALALSDRGLKIFPKNSNRKDHHRVLALRAESLLQLNRLEEAEKDAMVALEAGVDVDGHYTLGRVAERRHDRAKAKDHYNKAFAAAKQPEQVKHTRLALARVLAGPEATDADLTEAASLADQAIAAGHTEGYLVKARVLHRQKKFAEAVEASLLALQNLTPTEYGANWAALARDQAAAKGDWAALSSKADPAAAERLFGTGTRLYFAHQFAEAEAQLVESAKNNPNDARTYYFLALSRLPQGKIALAQEDLQHAVALEQQGLPDRATVNSCFERIQGPERQWINRFRK